ncbi:Uncharacterised protein [Enterococcus casseliflavus]|nr:Uncharacterised protein [Enterococcus casseliflavus]
MIHKKKLQLYTDNFGIVYLLMKYTIPKITSK